MPVPTSGAAARLIDRLGLLPHPEGGWFRETYRSAAQVAVARGPRAALTTIDYLLERGQVSRWHVVDADEVWHFHAGEPLELLIYEPTVRELARVVLAGAAPPAAAGAVHQAVVPAGHWQAARPLGDHALVGCTVAPGFDYGGFRFVASLPGHREHFAGPLTAHRDLL
jgi:predicted cupin superfamily sugar epimerase